MDFSGNLFWDSSSSSSESSDSLFQLESEYVHAAAMLTLASSSCAMAYQILQMEDEYSEESSEENSAPDGEINQAPISQPPRPTNAPTSCKEELAPDREIGLLDPFVRVAGLDGRPTIIPIPQHHDYEFVDLPNAKARIFRRPCPTNAPTSCEEELLASDKEIGLLDPFVRVASLAGSPKIIPIRQRHDYVVDVPDANMRTQEEWRSLYMKALVMNADLRDLILTTTTEYAQIAEEHMSRATLAEHELEQLRLSMKDVGLESQEASQTKGKRKR